MALTPLDFPASPVVGQLYPDPPVTGQPTYTWNGSQWTSSKAAVTQIARTDALGWSGMQINGGMSVSQEYGTAEVSPVSGGAPKYVVDGFSVDFNHPSATFGCLQGASEMTGSGVYLPFYLGMNGGAAMASTGSEYFRLHHNIEGYRINRLGWGTSGAQPITISFWIMSKVAGTASLAVRSPSGIRAYVTSFAISAPMTWEYKTITVPGDTAAATWQQTNGVGMQISWVFAGAATYGTPANIWGGAGGSFVAPGQTNLFNGANGGVYITGVVVLPGIEAPTAAQSPLIMRPYDQELLTCKRYWQKLGGSAPADIHVRGYQAAGTAIYHTLSYLVEMRAVPTAIIVGAWETQNLTGLVVNAAGARSLGLGLIIGATGDAFAYTPNTSSYISLDARL